MNYELAIPVISTERRQQILDNLAAAEEVIDRIIPNWDYELPNDNFSFFALSGGVDSSVMLGIMLVKHYRELSKNGFKILLVDTGDEPAPALELLDYIEDQFGVEIVRIQNETLFGVLEKSGNYLPSAKSRWCTTRLKTKVYNDFLDKFILQEGSIVNTYVGINASESDRAVDLGLPGIEAYFPFVNQNITRKQITSIGAELKLMNKSYARGRSRSGCMHCFFMSKPELVSLYLEYPDEFAKGQAVEVLPEGVEDRILKIPENAPVPWGLMTPYPTCDSIQKGKDHFQFTGTTGDTESIDKEGSINWDFFDSELLPQKPKRKPKKCTSTMDMFGEVEENVADSDQTSDAVSFDERVLYIAVEHWYYPSVLPYIGHAAGIPYKSKLITFSTSQSGLTNSLNGWWYHRLAASKLSWDSEEQYAEVTHVAVYAIRFDEGLIPIMSPKHEGYTWFQDHSYASIRATADAIARASQVEFAREVMSNKRLYSWVEIEAAEKWLAMVEDKPYKFGQFIGKGHFKPKAEEDYEDSLDNQAATVRCVTCSI